MHHCDINEVDMDPTCVDMDTTSVNIREQESFYDYLCILSIRGYKLWSLRD